MATIHGSIRSDLAHGTDVAAETVSLKYYTVSGSDYTPADIDNGNVVLLESISTAERDQWVATDVAADTNINKVAITATPEVWYDDRIKNIEQFYNEAGMPAMGYRLHSKSAYGLTKECFTDDSVLEKGSVVELAAGTKLKAAASATSGSTVVGKIETIESTSRYTYYVVYVD